MLSRLRIEEVALRIGSSVQTINYWYRWKKLNPENEYAKLLPDYVQDGANQTRYWNSEDIWKLIEFKQKLPHGRKGILGDVTQKYRKGEKKNVKKTNHKRKGR